jgi:type III secretory pathway lipoprotein EscJ
VATIKLAQAAQKNNYLIFCCPSLETIKATYEDREQMEGTHQKIDALYNAYMDLMLELEPDYVYDYSNPRSYSALVRNVTSALGRM